MVARQPITLADSTGTFRPLLRLAIPVFAEESLNLLVVYTNWWLAGHFLQGTAPKAAMGLAAYFLWLVPGLFAAVAIGATAMVSRFVGAAEPAQARHAANQALLMGLLFAAGVTTAAWFGTAAFVGWMQLEGEAAHLATQYCRIVTPVIPAIMVEQVGAACLRGAGDTVTGFLIKAIVNAINMVVSASLVVGWGPIPRLGWEGLAIGTACGHGVGGLVLLVVLLRGRAGLRLSRDSLWPDLDLIRRLLRVGLPGGFDVCAVIGCHLVYFAIIGSLGTAHTAAHGLGVQIEALAYLPGTAFQVAAATMAGQWLGAGNARRAQRSVLATCALGTAFMTLAGVVFFFFGGALAAFFTGDQQDETAQLATRLLRIVAFSMPSLAVNMILTGALRGAGDTRWPLIVTVLGLIGIRLPGACWLAWDAISIPGTGLQIAGAGWGVEGAWLAMVADLILRSLLVAWRFVRGAWTRIRV